MTAPDRLDIDMSIGEAIRAARLQTGFKQEDVALALGVDRTTVSRYEAGTRSIPIHVLLGIAHLLRVPLTTFIPGGREMEGVWAPPRSDKEALEMIRHVLALRPDITPQLLEFLAGMPAPSSRVD